MLVSVELVDDRGQSLLAREGVEADDQSLGGQVHRARPVEEGPPDGPHVAVQPVPRELHRQVANRAVHQRHHPPYHLQSPSLEPWPHRVGTVLVVPAWRRIHELVMYLHPIPLLVLLPLPEVPQHPHRLHLARRVQWVPAVLLWPWHYLPAYHRPYRLLRRLPLEHCRRLGQPDLLVLGPRVRPALQVHTELLGRQRLPQSHPVW